MFAEISVAVGVQVPRYTLWMEIHELGWSPDAMTLEQALAYLDGPLKTFLVQNGLGMSPRARRRMRRAVAGFSPNHPTPSERLEAWAR
jgi:hypothetical protein